MVNQYTINVNNQSGIDQQYAIFNDTPTVTTGPGDNHADPLIWSNVFATANTPLNESATFIIFKQWSAQISTSDGSPEPGTSVELTEGPNEKNFPQFKSPPPKAAGEVSKFQFVTDNNFSNSDAKQWDWLIGFGSSNGSEIGPASLFTPEANVQYQIEPVNHFYLSFGTFTENALFNVTKIGPNVLIKFDQLAKDTVNILHNENGELVIQP
ncbi:hypothetical protein K491DRAFT_717080 [Lophiostoma macrostomum CBS 122681]|uniref:Uncharacterized protein n=1 Tax=Lophiostoma macrostomum CBS 122681 TaxID=1314788 RepID=A0A6A6T6M0_9PLEO|nr:hypothetical protein K491DRAFT_717080 [Lophiostoma macrostomum CBS 122681]